MITSIPQNAIPSYQALSQFTGYPSTALRTAKNDKRLPVRVLCRIGYTILFDRQDAERLARAYPAKITRELYKKLVAQQGPQVAA